MKMRYKGSNEWIGKGVHEVELVKPWYIEDWAMHVYVMDIGRVPRLRYEDEESYKRDWEEME